MINNPQIIYRDKNLVVLNKPAGMIVNNADTSRNEYTVQDYIVENEELEMEQGVGESEFAKRGGIVHRLDKETSGALIVALNEASFINLQAQFKERRVKKEYIALVHGKLVSEGEINVPIGRLPWNRMRFGVIPQGRESYTKFKTISYKKLTDGKNREELSLVEVFPQSGRTHQIRVHMQYAGHPIFADALYAGRKTIARDRKRLPRHFLHASKITFDSPTTGAEVSFIAPMPFELVDFLAQLT
jgi:23S rRNA pseudouridine1911/1915/1917 synthase